ncbi:hypothetical protein J4H92_02395 [Leucobacter weissii]|uniref:Uncharacterized protein n=1 Tax=Leucobacter weissii TaxID=1983706 RepID=A0A939MIT7_9MICO|nr:LppA family lipoprotein [Leucobacter weissii]MBO1900795.1 hypothetical protein [Leucobacter weissii]
MSRAPGRAARAATVLPIALLLALTAGSCASSPTTSYRDEAGRTVTVDWADYPASAGIEADAVLASPTVEETEARVTPLMNDLKTAIDAELDGGPGPFSWSLRQDPDEGNWFPTGGNGYGGGSMLLLYNSPVWQADVTIPEHDWDRVLDAAEEVAERHGLPRRADDCDSTREEDACDPAWAGSMRSATFHGTGTEWLDISVFDLTLDEGLRRDAEEYGWLPAGIELFAGATAVRERDRDEFVRRAAPFEGLALPDETHSD